MNISSLTKVMAAKLEALGDCSRLEAELLIAHALKLSRAQLYAHCDDVLNDPQKQIITELLERRLQNEPMAYIVGYKEFWSLNLKVTPAALIPRPETESLVEWVLTHFSKQRLKLADLGTGSGAIALALASEQPQWQITATDYSQSALNLAQENARDLKLNHIEFKLGDWCHALSDKDYGLIISNPPYIAAEDPHLNELKHEPSSALIAKEQGLADLKHIAQQASAYLIKQGCLVLEHGFTQGEAVRKLLQEYGYAHIETHQDLGGRERFTTAVSTGSCRAMAGLPI